MKKVSNKIMLITYADCMGHDLKDLHHILNLYFKDAVKMVHILPFFPSSGDRGFAPLGYEKVSEEFGDWEDIRMLSEEYPLMFDYMINHISRHTEDCLSAIRIFGKMECQPRQKRMLFISGSPEHLMLWQSLGIRPRRQSGVPLERNRSTLTWRQRKESAFWKKIFAGWPDTVHRLSAWTLLLML